MFQAEKRRGEKEQIEEMEKRKMIDFNPTISIDTLNVNDLQKNVKIQQFSDCIKK